MNRMSDVRDSDVLDGQGYNGDENDESYVAPEERYEDSSSSSSSEPIRSDGSASDEESDEDLKQFVLNFHKVDRDTIIILLNKENKYNTMTMLKRRKTNTPREKTLPVRHMADGGYCRGMEKRRSNTRQKTLPGIAKQIGNGHGNRISTVMVIISWFFLGSLSMITRCIAIYQSPYRIHDLLYLPLFIGVMQDVLVILQSLTIMWCLRMLLGGIKTIHSTIAMVFCNLVPFLDILLQLQSCPRVDMGFVINLCYNFRIFYPSLKQAASSWTVAGIFVAWFIFLFIGACRLTSYANSNSNRLFQEKRRLVIVVMSVYIFWAICIGSCQNQDQSLMYCVENIIFKLQHEILGNSGTATNKTQFATNAVEKVTSASEIYTMPELSLYEQIEKVSYPTLRETIGYQGPKLFDILETNEDPNIILIIMESWKDLRYLGPNARRIITPEFDKLCSTGIHFDAHYTPSVQTSRTIMSNLFGNLPETLIEAAIKSYPTLNLKGLPNLMHAKGYHNAFISAVDLNWDNWDTQLVRFGFDQLVNRKDLNKLLKDRNYPLAERDGRWNWGLWDEEGFDGLFEHLSDLKANGTKAFVNFYSISSHWPYHLPYSYDVPEDIEQFSRDEEDQQYLATLSYSDEHLGRFISKSRQAGLLNNTIVLIQGDHGGPSPAHVTNGVHNEVTHLPALLLADGLLPTVQIGKSISQVSSQADVFATVADIIGIPEGGMLNHGIGSSMMREDPDKIVFLENPFQSKTIGCLQGDMKIVQEGTTPPKVYNMSLDPLEEHPISSYNVNKTTALIEMTRQLVDMYSSLYGTNQFAPKD